MPAFFYYLPGSDVSPRRIAALGLGYALGGSFARRDVHGGPDGGDGVLLADAARLAGDELGYYPAKQKWRIAAAGSPRTGPQSPDCAYFIGLYANHPAPGPADLLRPDALQGHELTLLDGNRWLVPIARGYAEEDGDLRWYKNLPQVLDLDDDGHWTRGAILPRYAALWDLACRWEQARMNNRGREPADGPDAVIRFQFADIIDAAVTALAANYAIGRLEAALAGLLSEEAAVEVLDALIDLPTRLAWCKKKLAAESTGEDSSVSPADSTAAIDPP